MKQQLSSLKKGQLFILGGIEFVAAFADNKTSRGAYLADAPKGEIFVLPSTIEVETK